MRHKINVRENMSYKVDGNNLKCVEKIERLRGKRLTRRVYRPEVEGKGREASLMRSGWTFNGRRAM